MLPETQSGLPKRRSSHGLRKAAAIALAEAGCRAREIMSITGHKSLSEAERYTRDVDQSCLAESAIAKLVAMTSDTPTLENLSHINDNSFFQRVGKGMVGPEGLEPRRAH